METIGWKTMEFEKKDKHPDWLWSVGLISLLGATVCFFYGNIFFGIFLILAGLVVIIYAFQEPKELEITISELGVKINDNLIPYKLIPSFWLDENGKTTKLLLLVTGNFVPTLSLPLVGVKESDVREILIKYIKEVENRESRSIALFDRLGF
jgi:hypothetical protein